MTWLRSLLGKLGHVNGNIVHRDLADLKDALSKIQGELSEVKSKATEVKSEISSVNGGISAVKGDISTVKSEVLAINMGMSAVNGGISKVNGELSAVKSEISTVKLSLNQIVIQNAKDLCDRFNIMYYDNGGKTWQNTYWLGVSLEKYPMDLWIYQEILFEVRPDVIIECGTLHGGSALFLASICDLLNNGRVITIDIQPPENRPQHSRISYFSGSSVDTCVAQNVIAQIRSGDKVLVILDSDHSQAHVLAELLIYSPLVTLDSYLIVEDTNINGHPVFADFGPGPMEAVEEFLKSHSEFVADTTREKFYVTANPMGYLKKVNGG